MSTRGPKTLVDLLRARAEGQTDALAYAFLENGEELSSTLTYGRLWAAATVIGARLAACSAAGERVLLLYPPGLDYVAAFFGCLSAGAVAVPAYPPDPARLGRTLPRLRAIARDAQISTVLTINTIKDAAKALVADAPELREARWIATDVLSFINEERLNAVPKSASSLALLQYTSGSTAAPKGVMITHENLLANLEFLAWGAPSGPSPVSASWLPAYHDMGLIESILHPLYGGYPAYLMSPAAFLERPVRWLAAISRYGVTTSGGPNFAYDLCVRKISEAARVGLDLRTWTAAFNGAEPIRADTLRRFSHAFAPCGFRRTAFHPVYGLAEATLLVSTGATQREPVLQRFQTQGLRAGLAIEAPPLERADELVSAGNAWLNTRVVIVDEERRVARPEGEIGEIWIAGPGVAAGYWGRDEETARVFKASLASAPNEHYLRSGDLGFLHRGELFITGRSKDCIILHGAKHAPHDIELTAEQSLPAARPGCAAAFSIGVASGEAAALALEVSPHLLPSGDSAAVMADAIFAVRKAVADRHGVALHSIALLEPRSIPKTSSGKIRRGATREALASGELSVLAAWTAKEHAAERSHAENGHTARANGIDAAIAWISAQIAARAGISHGIVDKLSHPASYGIDSLACHEILTEAASTFGRTVPASDLLALPSIHAIARRLSGGEETTLLRRGGEGVDDPNELIEIEADMSLLADMNPPSPKSASEPRAILLTGATGFFGGYLVRELLSRTRAEIYCLARGGALRLMNSLRSRGLWNEESAGRIHVIDGDLCAPGLGLASATYEKLAADIDSIYHCAASVNWVYPYRALRETNVLGTAEILRLACSGAPKDFHFISTLAVCHFIEAPGLHITEATDVTALLSAARLGYVRSKIAAEALVKAARDRGLSAAIYRPSFVLGDSASGESKAADIISSLIKGCIQMGSAPDIDWSIDGCPVDFAARAVAALALAPRTKGAPLPAISHITGKTSRPFRELVLWMNVTGYSVRLKPYSVWLDELLLAARDPSHALHSLRGFFARRAGESTLPELYEDSRRPTVDSLRTSDALAALGVDRPLVDARLLDRIFSGFIRRGFLALPRAPRIARSRADQSRADHGRALPLGAEALEPMLRRHLNDDAVTIKRISAEPRCTDHSLLTELTSLWHDRRCGLFNYRIVYESKRNGETTLNVVVKAKPPDEAVLDVGRSVASVCGEAILRAYEDAEQALPARGCRDREIAVYMQSDPRFRDNTPRLIGTTRGDDGAPWAIVMEDLSELYLFDSADDVSAWDRDAVDAAIRGLAELHAIHYGRAPSAIAPPVMAFTALGSIEGARRLRPLWRALAEHAAPLFAPWYGEDTRRLHQSLADEIEQWWTPMTDRPQTLLHNDFNPRNIALRRPAPGRGARLCAYDWELAAVGAPQRDLMELLCFVLRPETPIDEAARWIELHRASLEREANTEIDDSFYRIGVKSVLAELLVDRLSIYAMAHAVRRQRFLPRVIRAWKRLYDWSQT